MAFALQISTLSGEPFHVSAHDSWSVWDLKCATEKMSGIPASKQRLIDARGNELRDSSLLSEQVDANATGSWLTLIKTPRTAEEIAWEQQWEQCTPLCWQQATEVVLDRVDFRKAGARASKIGAACPYHYDSRMPKRGMSCYCCPVKPVEFIDHDEPLTINNASEIIGAASKGQIMRILGCGTEIEIDIWRYRLPQQVRCLNVYPVLKQMICKVSREVLYAAIQEEPALILPHVDISIVSEVVQKHPGMFGHVPESLRSTSLLYDALSLDLELRAEFLRTASKSEINAWKWDVNSKRCRKKKR